MNTVIIGGGAAGSCAAVFSGRIGDRVVLIEPNGKIGKKLAITGKGRCNITNNCGLDVLMKNIFKNPSFLYSSFSRFDTADCMSFFEELGVPLKTERGGRVFPVSDKASDIVDALEREIEELGIKVVRERAIDITVSDGRAVGVKTDKGFYSADKVILATGGMSYRATGSTGDGYRIASKLGHTVTELKPALVPMETEEDFGKAAGLTAKNITLTLWDRKKNSRIFSELGELTFESYGIGGPLALSASAFTQRSESGRYYGSIDFKPGLETEKLDNRLLREINGQSERSRRNDQRENESRKGKSRRTAHDIVLTLLPSQLAPYILEQAKIDPLKNAAEISKNERKALCGALKEFPLSIKGLRPINEAIITDGGISVREIEPKTMQSKLIGGLYFAGEIIDAAGLTGGFNLQIAYSTAKAAAQG